MDTINLKGSYRLIHEREGKVLSDEVVKNLVTSVGKAQVALLIGDATAIPFTYIALGTSTTAPTVADTTLTAEIVGSGLARTAGTVTCVTTSTTNDTYRVSYTFTATATVTVEEVGIFNASSAGTMLSHALTTTKALSGADILTVQYNLQLS